MKLSLIAKKIGGELSGDGDLLIEKTAAFENAGEADLVFAGDAGYLKKLSETKAGAVIVPKGSGQFPRNVIYVDNPRAAFVNATKLFHPEKKIDDFIHNSAVIGQNLNKGESVHIAANSVIGDNVVIGKNVQISACVVISDNVVIGDDVKIFPNVTLLEKTIIGSRVVIHSGSVIGSDGYGFAPEGNRYIKIPHTGNVRIDDDVEIGACNAIDRATSGTTWIKRGVKTDNMVHIAHNVVVGEDTLLVAQVGIAGSTKIGQHSILAGKVGVAGHIEIGDNSIIGPGAGILKSVGNNEVVSGTPGMPHKLWLRVQGIIAKLPEFKKKLNKIEKRIDNLENK